MEVGEIFQTYDLVQTGLAFVGTYLLYPLMNGEMKKGYELFGSQWKTKGIAALELSVADFVAQWIAFGPGKLLSGSREPINALSAGALYGLERKFFHKDKSFVKSFIGGTAIDSVAIVLTEPLTKIVIKPKNPIVIPQTTGAHYSSKIQDNSIAMVNRQAKINPNGTTLKGHEDKNKNKKY